MRRIILIPIFLYMSNAYAENIEIKGCESKDTAINGLSKTHALFQFCGFDNQPKQKALLQKIEQYNNEQCNFTKNEIKPDQENVAKSLRELKSNYSVDGKKLSKSCDQFKEYLQQTVSEYEKNKKTRYEIGSFDDPNIPGGYKQRCGMIVGHLNRTISDYQDAYYGKMPLDLMDEDRTIMSRDDSIPYSPYQVYDLDMKIKKMIFSDKKYASKLYTFMNNFKKQCLVDIQKYDMERTKRNSLHDYSKD